ncbi:hypothetical protein [Enterococcus sp. AZ072]|uniref:hypothetical protein n=1 Tax=unclassified Enterococcus TaxID=2608891 RepID=UPI003D2AF98D
MKKILVLVGAILFLISPVISEAATLSDNEDVKVSEKLQISPRGVYTYVFSYVPPKTFNGRTRIYYEYISKDKIYIGYYQ